MVTYGLAVLWLLVFAFSALPVYFFYNMDATCYTIEVLTETPASINQLCVDARQYGKKKDLHVLNHILILNPQKWQVCERERPPLNRSPLI